MSRTSADGTGRTARGCGRRQARDAGNAALEFLSLGVLLMVPLLYLVLVLARVQAASMAADEAATLGARAFASSSTETSGRRAVAGTFALALGDHGLTGDARSAGYELSCPASTCLRPGEPVQVSVAVRVPLPGIPRFLAGAVPDLVTVRSRQVVVVDRFRPAS